MKSIGISFAVFLTTAFIILLNCGVVNAEILYSNDWNTDPQGSYDGWTYAGSTFGWDSTAGVDDTGCLKVTRSGSKYPGNIFASGETVISAIGGDLASQYSSITLTMDIKLYESYSTNANGSGWWVYDSAGLWWVYNLETPPNPVDNVWNHYSVTLDPSWTDAEANAAGWVKWNSTASWGDLMSNVTKWAFTSRAYNYGATGTQTTISYLDNFVAEGVRIPEPSTLALLACGLVGLLAYAWRKRK